MQKARRHSISKLRPLVSVRFQVLFNFSVRDSFHLSFTVLVHYRSISSIQPYQMVLAVSRKASPTPRYSGYHYPLTTYAYGTITLYRLPFQVVQLLCQFHLWSYNPGNAETLPVWALPSSLATTLGIIIIFSSSAYLDVSVQRVILRSCKQDGLPHSDIYGSKLLSSSPQLFAAWHVLLRL